MMDRGNFKGLALDMVVFSVVRNMVENQQEFKDTDREGFAPQNFTFLCQFAGLFFKQFHHSDLLPVFEFVLSRMQKSYLNNDPLLISQIFSSMIGWTELDVTILNEKQLQSLAGGLWMKLELMKMTQEYKKTKRPEEALKNLFFGDL
jgi:inhibitor of KinA sporulation pathway (predicted exonuclease)